MQAMGFFPADQIVHTRSHCRFIPLRAKRIRVIQGDTKKRELLKNPTKIEEIQEKKNY